MVITKKQVECFEMRLPKFFTWANFYIDEIGEGGTLSIVSDYGNWSYTWPATGGTLKQFLPSLDIYYTAKKFGADKYFDIDRTLENAREFILISRRDNSLDKESARELYDEVSALARTHPNSSNEFFYLTREDCPNLFKLFYENSLNLYFKIDPAFEEFWRLFWIPLMEYLKENYV